MKRDARIARKAASVSHDGEAVHAAAAVAAMVSAAFVDRDMDRLLDIAASVIPEDCLLARVHRDVRGWARETGDWRKTFVRIEEPQHLDHGDYVFLGQQLLRVEVS